MTTRTRRTRTEADALEAALLAATGHRWQVRYHRGTARGWFDVLPLKRDRRTVYDQTLNADDTYTTVPRLLRGDELAQTRAARPWALKPSPAQIATLKALFGEWYHYDSNVPGDEAWLTWVAAGRQGPEPRKGFRDWD